ncbi:MAG: hypothetical protein AAGF95_06625 [Chloroflexota bacterium]
MLTRMSTRLSTFLAIVFITVAGLVAQSTTPVSAAGLSISPGTVVEAGQEITITVTGGCTESRSWLGLYDIDASNREYGPWTWCPDAPWTLSAPTTPGRYQVRALGDNSDGDWFDDLFGTVTFDVISPKECQTFTSTGRWGNLTVGNLLDAGIPIPDEARDFLDQTLRLNQTSLTGYLAFVQLYGDWCYQNGQVSDLANTRVVANPTGVGDFLFETGNVFAGSFRQQDLGGQTDYVNDGTRADVFLVSPAKVTLTVPGTEIGIEIPAGTRVKVATVFLTTRLTGQGNTDCTQSFNPANCDVVTLPLGTP